MFTSFLFKMAFTSATFSLVLAIYVLYRDPRKTDNIGFAAGMMTLSFISFCHFMDYRSFNPFIWKNLAFAGRIFLPVPWLVFSVVFARSNPSEHLRKWRTWIGGVSLASFVVVGILLYNSFGADKSIIGNFRSGASVFIVISIALVLANFERTLRSGEHQQRWRIKFLIVGVGSIFLFMIFNMSYVLLFPTEIYDYSHVAPTVIFIGSILSALSLIRHSMLDVDIAVSRDIVSNSIIVLLIGGSLFAVGIVAQSIRMFGGDFGSYFEYLFVFLALVFIVLALLSTHARKTAKMFIDRHFFRSKFDYGKEWLRLTDRLSSKLDVHELASSLARFFYETFWINTMMLWIIDDGEEGFRMVYPVNDQQADPIRGNPTLLRLVSDRDQPVLLGDLQGITDLPKNGEEQIALLKKRGVSLLVPLMIEMKRVGVLGLSKSRYGVPFDKEDLALIYTIARQAAGSFLSAQFAERIVLSKELETFHLFSTFVIHDLKNFMSMLSLVVQNMEKNFSNPAFQKDAMASISNIVDKMERMMTRLSALSAAPVPCRTRTDLNDLLRGVMEEMKGAIRSKVVVNYRDLPNIWIDPEQIMNVIRNLVRNADEATGNDGEIRLATETRDGNVLISVSDNGCGIPREYMQRGLYTLFSTTKSDGFGIGLYQSKRIVESHGGRIEAESEIGRGSTFRIHLPIVRE